jgi:hypothetical protein
MLTGKQSIKITPHWGWKVFMSFGTIEFLWFTFLSIINHGTIYTTACFLIFAGLCLFCLIGLFRTAVIVDTQGIRRIELFRSIRIRWEDVTHILTDRLPNEEVSASVTFITESKQLPLLINYGGKNAGRMRRFIAKQIMHYHIQIVTLSMIVPWLSTTPTDGARNSSQHHDL